MGNSMRIAVDLLWVKHGLVGGIETYILNLLEGLCEIDHTNSYVLIVSEDNEKIFEKFSDFPNFCIHKCNVLSTHVLSTILWENLHLDKIVSSLKADFCFVPYYRKPCFRTKNKYLIVLHDLQALHFPQYFSKAKYLWLKNYWGLCLHTAKHIIAISKFVKEDIVSSYKIDDKKVSVIYNPILTTRERNNKETLNKYDLVDNGYFYTISSLLKHKNLITILKAISILKKKGLKPKLVITGIKGNSVNEISNFIVDNDLTKNCIYTGYISDEEKFDLLRGCKTFLFPSIFEGFGMPPIESLMVGKQVITTKCTCIPEVTENKAIYVDDPSDSNEWAVKMQEDYTIAPNTVRMMREKYSPIKIAADYVSVFKFMFHK